MEKNKKYNVKLIAEIIEVLRVIDYAHNDPDFDIFSLADNMENFPLGVKREILKLFILTMSKN